MNCQGTSLKHRVILITISTEAFCWTTEGNISSWLCQAEAGYYRTSPSSGLSSPWRVFPFPLSDWAALLWMQGSSTELTQSLLRLGQMPQSCGYQNILQLNVLSLYCSGCWRPTYNYVEVDGIQSPSQWTFVNQSGSTVNLHEDKGRQS